MQEILTLCQGYLTSLGVQSLFIQAFIFGAILALPVGPWSIFAMQQTQTYGRPHGFLIGLTATLADACVAAITAYKFKDLYPWLQSHENSIYIFSSVMMMVFGLFFLFKKNPNKQVQKSEISGLKHLAIQALKFVGFKGQQAKKSYKKLVQSHRFVYLATFVWSAFHPAHILSYVVICFLVQSLGHDLTQVNVALEYVLPIFLATISMWSLWIFFGKKFGKVTFYLIKIFGAAFLITGFNLFFSNVL
ncbi:MAG: hypothetical protein VXY83_03135 [Pseudomonadota bacterium]|nr:hypothetical protein [Pseudomonadota bacterium]